MNLDAVSDKERRLFVGQLRRQIDGVVARLAGSAVSFTLSSGQEFACAFCDKRGRTVVESGISPILCGSLGAEVAHAIAAWPSDAARDAILAVSDSAAGGLDAATLTFIAPLIVGTPGELCGYLALRVRHPALPFGIPAAGEAPPPPPEDELSALPPAVGPRYNLFQAPPPPPVRTLPRTVDDEGGRLALSPLTDALCRQLSRRSRAPRERLGDLWAQRESLLHGLERLRGLATRLEPARFMADCAAVLAHSEAAMRSALHGLPAGVYAFADSLDDDGSGRTDIGVRATCMLNLKTAGQLQIDLRESEDLVAGPLNGSPAMVQAVVRHVLERFLPSEVVRNDGLLAPVTVLLRPASLLHAVPPAPLALAADETAWRVADVIAGALSQAVPQQARAADCGTTSSLYLFWPSSGLLHRERLTGGVGGGPGSGRLALGGASLSAELLERQFPLRVVCHQARAGSGGMGLHPGGDGERREIELLADAMVTLAGERRRRPPYGLAGGGPGTVGRDTLQRKSSAGGAPQLLPGKAAFAGRAGDRLCIESPGGGGHGDAQRAAFFAALLG